MSRASSALGFRPLEYFVRLDERGASELAQVFGVRVPRDVIGLWGEVQLRTILEEVTLTVRDEVSRPGVPLPERWERDLGRLDEVLGGAQRALGRIYAGVKSWAGSYGAYLTEEQARRELAILEATLDCIPNDPTVAARAGKLGIILGEWERAIRLLEPHAGAQHEPVLRDLGVALCKRHEPGSVAHQQGLAHLEEACRLAPRDPDAFASLAGAWKRAGHVEKARDLYRAAHAIDAADPYALGGYLETALALTPTSDLIATAKPAIEKAVRRCRDQVAAAVNAAGLLRSGEAPRPRGRRARGTRRVCESNRAQHGGLHDRDLPAIGGVIERRCVRAVGDGG